MVMSDVDDTMLLLGTDRGLDVLGEFLRKLRSAGVEVVPVTFRTFNEMRRLMDSLKFEFPALIVEGGGAIYSIDGMLRFDSLPHRLDDYNVLELCRPISSYEPLLSAVELHPRCCGKVMRLSKADAAEVSKFLGLPENYVRDSQKRYYSDAFITLDGGCREFVRVSALNAGLKVVMTRRTVQVLGMDKAGAVRKFLSGLNLVGRGVPVLGVGDSSADYGFLDLVDIPIVISGKGFGEFKKGYYLRDVGLPPDSWIKTVRLGLGLIGLALT